MSTDGATFSSTWHRARGVTLVELVMSIVVIAVGVSGILAVMTYTSRHSADPMIQEQALLVGEAYMQEILIKPFLDPTTGTVCPAPPAQGRAYYDNVCDFDGLNDTGAKDQKGNAVAGLEYYNVAVTVSGGAGISLGPASNPVDNTGTTRVVKVDVTVTNSQAPDFGVTLTGYRVGFNCVNPGDCPLF